jgi:uncharacterized protein YbgA (DUF1722 family)
MSRCPLNTRKRGTQSVNVVLHLKGQFSAKFENSQHRRMIQFLTGILPRTPALE